MLQGNGSVRKTKIVWEKVFPVVEPQINAEGVHVWPFDPSFPIDIRFFDFAGRHNIRMNRHDYFELLYVHEGEVQGQIQDRCLQLREGDLLVIGSTLYHRFASLPHVPGKVAVLFFEPELVRAADVGGDDVEYLMPFFSQDLDFPLVVPPSSGIPAQVLDLIHRIHAEMPATSSRPRLSVKTYLKMILILLVNHYTAYLGTRETFSVKQKAIQRLRPLFDYLEASYDRRVQVRDAARICAMSNSHFMYFFKRVTGQSFLAYLNHFRIAKAQALLTSTDKSISEVSQEIAFCNQSYFGMVFRKLVGMTPLSYKRRVAQVGKTDPLQLVKPLLLDTRPPRKPAKIARRHAQVEGVPRKAVVPGPDSF